MAEKLTDEFVADLLTLLRSDAQLDAKVNQVTYAKSSIKQCNVPETCAVALFEALKMAATSPHSTLANAGFTALNHLFTRFSRQEPRILAKEVPKSLPIVIEKLGDAKEKYRTIANQSLVTMYGVAPVDVERFVRNTAMAGKSVRAKEMAMTWLLYMHQENGMGFRSYVPSLMDLLEDADPGVRETAKATVIELFQNAPNNAKSDLKRQLKNFKVRAAIEQAIIKALLPSGSAFGRPETPSDSRSNLALSSAMPSLPTERPVTPLPIETNAESLEPMYVNTARELDGILQEMMMHCDGRETEHNWIKREQSMTKLRRLMVGNVPQDFPEPFLVGLKTLLDGIVKSINSLRTSLSKEGCAVIQDAAATFGSGIDPLVEILLQNLIKLCAATKKISHQQANTTVEAIISRATYTNRIMQHIWGAAQDKNTQPRIYASGWLKIVLTKESHHKTQLEHSGGVDLIEKCLKKVLNDANPAAREQARPTFWIFYKLWRSRAEVIMDSLDLGAQKALNRHPDNPNNGGSGASAKSSSSLSKSAGTARPSLRETMMAQKKAVTTIAAKKENGVLSRPGSALAHTGPSRSTSAINNTSSAPAAPVSNHVPAIRAREGTSAFGGSSLSAAPVRPRRRVPPATDVQRPATAGPYSTRAQEPPQELMTPEPPSKTAARQAPQVHQPQQVSPKRAIPRPQSVHGSHSADAMQISPAHGTQSPTRQSPARPLYQSPTRNGFQSPTRASTSRPTTPKVASPPKTRPVFSQSHTALSPSKFRTSVSGPAAVEPKVEPTPAPALVQQTYDEPMEMDVDLTPVVQKPVAPEHASLKDITKVNEVQVYEDPVEQKAVVSQPMDVDDVAMEDAPVLADRSVNAAPVPVPVSTVPDATSEKARVNGRLLDSGIARVKSKTLDVHGFRKLQSLLREKIEISEDKFNALLLGLFSYLEDPFPSLSSDKAQDIKSQVLAVVKLLLKNHRALFQPHVSRGLEAIMATRAAYDAHTHIVSGLEVLAEDLIAIGDAFELFVAVIRTQQRQEDTTGLHVLVGIMERHREYVPGDSELAQMAELAGRCLDSGDSGVRMGAVQLAVAVHARVGEERFWGYMKGVKDDPKSLITYYIVKKQRDQAV